MAYNSYFKLILAQLNAFKNKNVPAWLADHKVFKGKENIPKIFKHFGIPNFREPIDPGLISLENYDLEQAANNLYSDISKLIVQIAVEFVCGEDRTKVETMLGIIKGLRTATSFKGSIQKEPSGKIKIVLTNNVFDNNGKIVFRQGESIFKALNKLKQMIEKLGSHIPALDTPIEQTEAFKQFSRLNIPLSKLEIVFSAENEGAYDIATMSMRGIDSCQAWNGSYKNCLVGSVLSKFVGIIYLTSGSKTDYGERMIRRCIVRFGVDLNTKKPVLVLDKMYDSYNAQIEEAFINALKKRTNLPIMTYREADANVENLSLPYEKEMEDLKESEYPYSDIGHGADSLEPKSKKNNRYLSPEEQKEELKTKLERYLENFYNGMKGQIRYYIHLPRDEMYWFYEVYNQFDLYYSVWRHYAGKLAQMMVNTGNSDMDIKLAEKRIITLLIRRWNAEAKERIEDVIKYYSAMRTHIDDKFIAFVANKVSEYIEDRLQDELKSLE